MPAPLRRPLACLLVALAAACGGGGEGTADPAVEPPPSTASKIWVGDRANAAIGSTANSNPPAGALAVQRVISGTNTQLSTSLFDFALDTANDRLYVADLRSILVFSNAGFATGNLAPSRTVSVIAGSFGGYSGGLHLDTANNRLYAGTNFFPGATQTVQVFDGVSAASFAAPTRSITFTIRDIRDIAVDVTRNILYVYGSDANGFTQILAFNNASGLSGSVVPNRVLSINDSGGSGPIGLFLDAANDRLYVPRNAGTISVFDLVSQANGAVAPSRSINLPVPTYSVVFVELSANRLYALDANGITITPDASSVSGTPSAVTRVLVPSGAQFQAIVVRP